MQESKLKKKVEFILTDKLDFKCDIHPDSECLMIDDDEKRILTSWCVECVYKALKETKGFWDVEKERKTKS